MIKLKTIPNQGTRKITLPVIGETSFNNGIFECEESAVVELMSLQIGFKLQPADAESAKAVSATTPPSTEDGSSEVISLDTLQNLRVKDLAEIFDESQTLMTEEEIAAYDGLKKADKAAFLYDVLNNRHTEEEEEEDEKVEEEESTEE